MSTHPISPVTKHTLQECLFSVSDKTEMFTFHCDFIDLTNNSMPTELCQLLCERIKFINDKNS